MRFAIAENSGVGQALPAVMASFGMLFLTG
jgi:hypothetical protein